MAEKTRKKIQACARKFGYRPDPALSALADYRRRTRPATAYTQVAYVTSYPMKDDPAWGFLTDGLLRGARKRGLEFGYDVISYWLPEGGCTLRQASSILFNRGIKGLLIAPLPVENGHLDITWKYFCSVAIGTSMISPLIDYAAFDHHEAMQVVVEKLRGKGYSRIGLFMLHHRGARLRYTSFDAYAGDQQRQPPEPALPPLLLDEFSSEEFWRWFDLHKPDAIITDADSKILDILKERGLSAPKHVGIACSSRFIRENTGIASVTQDLQVIGAAAVDRLHTNLLRSAYGVPAHYHGTLLHGHWAEGSTLRKRR